MFTKTKITNILRKYARIISLITLLIILINFNIRVINIVNSIWGNNGYVSDECWYVQASRNIMQQVLGIKPFMWRNKVNVTLVLRPDTDETKFKTMVMRYGGKVLKDDYTYFKAIYAEVPIISLQYLTQLPNITKVIYGYMYLNKAGIIDYLNLEHPPLGKYFIGISMLLCGDTPACWRLPSILSGNIMLIATYILILLVLKERGILSYAFATLAVFSLSLDELLINMSSIAMLDIFISLFTILTSLMIILRKSLLSSIFVGLAGSVKFSGFFNSIPLYFSLRRLGKNPANSILHAIYVPLLVFLLLSLPFMVYLGPWRWFNEGFSGAISWHLKQKHEVGKGPPIANPWDWLINRNPFVFHYNPNLYAVGKILAVLTYLPSAVLTVIILPILAKEKFTHVRTVAEWAWYPYIMYIIQFILGGKTQYSFYVIHVTPLIHAITFIALSLITNPKIFDEILREWYRILKLIWDWLGGEVRIKITISPQNA